MKKYCFIAYHAEYNSFLKELQGLSSAHLVSRGDFHCQELNELEKKQEEVIEVIGYLKTRMARADHMMEYQPDELVEKTLESIGTLQQITSEETLCRSAMAMYDKWGGYDFDKLKAIEKTGLDICFYSCSAQLYEKVEETEGIIIECNRDSKNVEFVHIGNTHKNQIYEALAPVTMPELPYIYYKNKYEDLLANKQTIHEQLDSYASHLQALLRYLQKIEALKKFTCALKTKSETIADNKLQFCEAWFPVADERKMLQMVKHSSVAWFEISDTSEPPILLKNSPFARLFEPVGRLFMLPVYAELDLTPFFAPFFLLLFGLCMADAGYGLFLFILGFAGSVKLKKEMKSLAKLVMLLGASSFILGIWLGTFGGITLSETVFFENLKPFFIESSKFFDFAIFVGFVQIVFGIAIRAINQFIQRMRTLALASAGWLLLIFSAILLNYNEKVGVVESVLDTGLVAGIILVVVFSSNSKSVRGRIGAGVWELYTTLTGIFGDLLSYIRLFALGTASGILGLVINQMSMQLSSINYVGPVLTVIFLLLGHSINIFLAVLGASVHSMRLTFVEFYKNAGFKGGGEPYRPFSN